MTLSSTACPADEPHWLASAQRGEPAALESLFRNYYQPVYSLCYRLLGRAEDAEDAAQATFVSAFRAMSKFRAQSSVKTWLYRIAVNESSALLRYRRRSTVPLEDLWPARDGAPEMVQNAAIAAVIGRMKPDQRLILILFYWEELSCDEIAAVLDISLSAAKMRLKRAREAFQREYGGET